MDRACAEGVNLVGPGGLLSGLTKSVVESALGGEMSEHLGSDKHDTPARNGGNSRNGARAKTVLTDPADVVDSHQFRHGLTRHDLTVHAEVGQYPR